MNTNRLILILLLVFSTSIAFGQRDNTVKKSFDVGSTGSLSISNSFGDVEITPYNGSKIDMTITISIEMKNDKDYEDYRDKIRIEAKEDGNNVSVRTINELGGGNKVKNFRINYDVKVPEKTNLKVRQTFGDVKINGSDGVLDINVQHGDCYIGDAMADGHEISLQFGDLRVEHLGAAEIDVQHGDLKIDQLTNKDLELQFGDGRIEILEGSGDVEVMHGDMTIESLGENIGDLEFKIQFGDLKIGGVESGSFDLEMDGNFSDFSWDGSFVVKSRDKGMNSESYKMETKSKKSTYKVIKIDASHSDVDID